MFNLPCLIFSLKLFFWYFDSVMETRYFNASLASDLVIVSNSLRVITHLFVINWGLRVSVLGMRVTMTNTFWVSTMLSFLRIIWGKSDLY